MQTLVQPGSSPSYDDDLLRWIDALKCQYQKNHSQNKWHSTLVEQRRRIALLLRDAPSMRASVQPFAQDCYPTARRRAALETHADASTFPAKLPYSVAQILDSNFIP